ncbi:hypothetical protein BCO18442_07111 [Burkholderia contaminans]|nr:hypothetical protein BCO18442_07111 [Burkholderia contaminans]
MRNCPCIIGKSGVAFGMMCWAGNARATDNGSSSRSHDNWEPSTAGGGEQQLRHCIRAAEVFPDETILSALQRELSWTHLKMLMYVEDPLKRDVYIELCRLERWSSRQLQERMQSMLFERSALSRQPDEVIRREVVHLRDAQQMTPDLALKDPYILDFLGLNDHYLERDLEDATLREMEQFLLELGVGFTFVARQKRLPIDEDDFYLDLLFYNRKLKRLVAIELKLDPSRPSIRVRWSCTCAGLRSTSRSRMKRRRSTSSCVREKSKNGSNCLSLAKAASMSLLNRRKAVRPQPAQFARYGRIVAHGCTNWMADLPTPVRK